MWYCGAGESSAGATVSKIGTRTGVPLARNTGSFCAQVTPTSRPERRKERGESPTLTLIMQSLSGGLPSLPLSQTYPRGTDRLTGVVHDGSGRPASINGVTCGIALS